MLDKRVKVKEIRELGARNHLLVLAARDQAALTRPGQFVMLKCADSLDEEPLLRRPFSIFDARPRSTGGRGPGIDVLVKVVGTGTARLAALRPGDEVWALGPQGRPFDTSAAVRDRTRTACLVAGGVGIAALLLLARELAGAGVVPVLFYGGRTEADLVLREAFEALGIETVYTTEDGSRGMRGQVTTALDQYLKGRTRTDYRIYACGPWGMMRAAHVVAERHRLPCDVSLEARMGCSLGACMGCVVRSWDAAGEEEYLRVCQEGPVMASRAVDWETPPL
jgi:dihydroorotate dehydrogenase electron transfer subunit